MEDLSPNFMKFSNPREFVSHVWETSQKNAAARQYIVGVIDALRWSHAITVKDYTELYERYVFGHGQDGTPCSS
jgi:hypothetical protein